MVPRLSGLSVSRPRLPERPVISKTKISRRSHRTSDLEGWGGERRSNCGAETEGSHRTKHRMNLGMAQGNHSMDDSRPDRNTAVANNEVFSSK